MAAALEHASSARRALHPVGAQCCIWSDHASMCARCAVRSRRIDCSIGRCAMWGSEADRQAAARHEWQVRSVTQVMLPMMDVASLVERTPESERRGAAEHERLTWMTAEHAIEVGETSPGVV